MKLTELKKEALKREFQFLETIYPFDSHQNIEEFKIKRVDENLLLNVPHTWGQEYNDINGAKRYYTYYFIKDGVIKDNNSYTISGDDNETSLIDIIWRYKIEFDSILEHEYEYDGGTADNNKYHIRFTLYKPSKTLDIKGFTEKLINEYQKAVKDK